MGLGAAERIQLLHSAVKQCQEARHQWQYGGRDKSAKMVLLRVCSELCFYWGAMEGCWTSGCVIYSEHNPTAALQLAHCHEAICLSGERLYARQWGFWHREEAGWTAWKGKNFVVQIQICSVQAGDSRKVEPLDCKAHQSSLMDC